MTYKAFVSSTYEDLKAHREHAISELRRAGIQVDPMEDWTSTSNEPKRFSQQRLEGCDFCVLLVALRRGFVPAGETRSITQLEYDEARRRGLDVLTFMVGEDVPWRRRFDELDSDPQMPPWRQHLTATHGVGFFDHEPDSIDIAPAVARWIAEQQRRSDSADAGPEAYELPPTGPPSDGHGEGAARRHRPLWRQPAVVGPVAAALLTLAGVLATKFVRTPDKTPPRKAQITELRPTTPDESKEEGFAIFYEGASDDRSLQEVRLWARFQADGEWSATEEARTGEKGRLLFTGLDASGVYLFDAVSTDGAGNVSHDPRGTNGQLQRIYLQSLNAVESLDAAESGEEALVNALKDIQTRRPALLLGDDGVVPPIPDYWASKVESFGQHIRSASEGTGRIEVINSPNYSFIATGFVIAEGLIVTQGFAASMIYRRVADRWVPKRAPDGKMIRARIDFAEYHDDSAVSEYAITGVRYMAEKSDTDALPVAVLEVAELDIQAHPPLALYAGEIDAGTASREGYVIGYPAFDPRLPPEVSKILYGEVYNVKRFMPGKYRPTPTTRSDGQVTHDCSTVGGTSGGPLVDLETGAVVGVHGGGRFDEITGRKNGYADSIERLRAILAAQRSSSIRRRSRAAG